MEFPEKDEIVIAVVKKILPYGAFCAIPEYNTDAFLHISQVSSGWVKNIHEFISEGQRLVVKISHIDSEKNQIDVSLKAVTDDEKRNKLDSLKRSTKGEKLLELAIKNAKLKSKVEDYREAIEEEYGELLSCFEECSENNLSSLEKIEIPKKLKEEIVAIAKSSIKKSKIILKGMIMLSCPDADGIDKIKSLLAFEDENLKFTYLGAPNYKFSFTCDDYKNGEKELSKIIAAIEKKSKESNCSFSFKRDDS